MAECGHDSALCGLLDLKLRSRSVRLGENDEITKNRRSARMAARVQIENDRGAHLIMLCLRTARTWRRQEALMLGRQPNRLIKH